VSICGTSGRDGPRLRGFDETAKSCAELEMIASDIAGQSAQQWPAKGVVWSTIGEGLYLARLLGPGEQDLTNFQPLLRSERMDAG
jgi:hypothetical protein